MTICVSVKVAEGLVLAADSTSTVQGWVGPPQGEPRVLKTYDHARKLTHLKDYPIGVLSWGAGQVGARTVASLIKEYEYTLESLEEENEKRKERRMRGETEGIEPFRFSVQKIAEALFSHLRAFYKAELTDRPETPALGVLVSGYSSGQFFPEQWRLELPSGIVVQERADREGRPEFGANWFGAFDAINRLHHGRDDRAVARLAQQFFNGSHEEAQRWFAEYEYPVLFEGMPLQDAIDYAVYLVNVAIGRYRFVIGAPVVGGDIDVAVMTPNTYTWIQRKSWRVRTAPVGK